MTHPTQHTDPIQRPSIGKLIRYCYGGTLPPENHAWVLHDVTCRTWVLRHFGRWMMVVVPVFVLFLSFFPTPFGIRLYVDIAVCGAILLFALVNIQIDTDRRAVRAGYTFSVPSQIRQARAIEHQRTSNARRRERIAARRLR